MKIERDLSAYNGVLVLVIDEFSATHQYLPLPPAKLSTRRLDLQSSLDPDKAFSEVRKVEIVRKGSSFMLESALGSKFQVIDSLAQVGNCLSQLNNESTAKGYLQDFRLLEWEGLARSEKDKLITRYFSHELHLFLAVKDPSYFREAVQPLLVGKLEKTAVDYFLLGDKRALEKYFSP